MSADDLAFVTGEVELSSFIPQALFFKLRCSSGEERLGYCVGHRLFVDGARIPGTRNRIERFVQMRNDRPLFATVAVPKSAESADSFVFKTSDGTTYPTSCQSRCLWVGEPSPPAAEMEKTFTVGQPAAAAAGLAESGGEADSTTVNLDTPQPSLKESEGPQAATSFSLPAPLPSGAAAGVQEASEQTTDMKQIVEDTIPLSESLLKLMNKTARSCQPPIASSVSFSEGRVVSSNTSSCSGLIAFEHAEFGPQLAFYSWAAIRKTDYPTKQKWASSFPQEVFFDAVCSPCDSDGNALNQSSRTDKPINWQCTLVWVSKWSVPPVGPKLTLPLPKAATVRAKAALVTCVTERDGVLELRSNDEFYGRWAHFLRGRVFINGIRAGFPEALDSQLRVGEMVHVDAIDRKYLTEGFCHEDTTLVALLVWKGDKPDENKFAEATTRQFLYKCRVASLIPGDKPVGVRSGLVQIIGGPSATTSNVGEMVHFDRECLSVMNESMARADLAHVLRLDVNVFSDKIVQVTDPEEIAELARLHGCDVRLRATAIWRLRMPTDEHEVLDAKELEYLSRFQLDEAGLRKLADGGLPAKTPIKVKVPIPPPTTAAQQMISAVRSRPHAVMAKLVQLLKPARDESSGGVAEFLVRVEHWTVARNVHLTVNRANVFVMGFNMAKADLSYVLRTGERFEVEVEDVGDLDEAAVYQVKAAYIGTRTKTPINGELYSSKWLAERGLNASTFKQLVAGEMASLPYTPLVMTCNKAKVVKLLEPTISAGLPGDGADAFVAIVTKGLQAVETGAEVLVERDVFHVYGTCMAKADLSYCLSPGDELKCEVIAMPDAHSSRWVGQRGWKRPQDVPRYMATHAYVGTRAPYAPGVAYGDAQGATKRLQTENKGGLAKWISSHCLNNSTFSDLVEGKTPPLKNNLSFMEVLAKKSAERPEVEILSDVRRKPRSPKRSDLHRSGEQRSRSPIQRIQSFQRNKQPLNTSQTQNPLLQYASRGPVNREQGVVASSPNIPVLNRYSVCPPPLNQDTSRDRVQQQAAPPRYPQEQPGIPLFLPSQRHPYSSAPPAPAISHNSGVSAMMPSASSAAFIPSVPSCAAPIAKAPEINSANAVLSLAKTLLGRVLTCTTPDDAVGKNIVADDRELRLAKFMHKTLEVCITSFQEKQLTMLVNPMLEEHSSAPSLLSQQRYNPVSAAQSLHPAGGLSFSGRAAPPPATRPAQQTQQPASWQQFR